MQLTPEEKQQIVAYTQGQAEMESEAQSSRIPGLFPGIWMSEDFDDELPEFFWLGAE
jgi:hypothetical protein